MSLFTASGFTYGAVMVGGAALVATTILSFSMVVVSAAKGRGIWIATAAMPALAALLCLNSVAFQEGPVLQPRTLQTNGPAAGLWTAGNTTTYLSKVHRLLAPCGNSRTLIIGLPGAYLWAAPRSAAVSSWLDRDFVHALDISAQQRRGARCVIAFEPRASNGQLTRDFAAQQLLLRDMTPATPTIVMFDEPVHGERALRTYVRSSR